MPFRVSCLQEKERRKRRPTSVFSNKAAQEDIESILSITLELLDKWGRYYEVDGTPGGAKIVDAWKELTKENVRFPQGPAEYVFLTKPSASRDAGAFGFGGGSSSFGGFGAEVSAPVSGASGPSGVSGELSEPALQGLAAAVQSAIAQYGPGSPEAGEATAHFESMLAQWQHAAAEAVEKGDMAAYEHFSAVAVRYAELQIGSPSASTEFSRTFSGVSGVSPSPPDSDTVPESHSSSHKKHRRRKKQSQPEAFEVQPEVAMTPSFGHPQNEWAEADAAAAAYRAGEFGGSFGVGSSGFASDPGDSSDPFGAPSGAHGMSTEDFGGLGGGLSGSFPDASMAQFGSAWVSEGHSMIRIYTYTYIIHTYVYVKPAQAHSKDLYIYTSAYLYLSLFVDLYLHICLSIYPHVQVLCVCAHVFDFPTFLSCSRRVVPLFVSDVGVVRGSGRSVGCFRTSALVSRNVI